MIPAAIIFPPNPEAAVFDLVREAQAACKAGQRLYTNGRQMALLPRPIKGWALVATVDHTPEVPPCAA